MWTTAGSLLAFLISNGPTLISTGLSVGSLVSDFLSLIHGAKADGKTDITKDQFNTFVDKCLGQSSDLDALITQAKAELA